MAIAKRDTNSIPTKLAVLDSDGLTIMLLRTDPVAHILVILDAATGSDKGTPAAKRDSNYEETMMAVSSADNSTPVALYINSSNQLLIKST